METNQQNQIQSQLNPQQLSHLPQQNEGPALGEQDAYNPDNVPENTNLGTGNIDQAQQNLLEELGDNASQATFAVSDLQAVQQHQATAEDEQKTIDDIAKKAAEDSDYEGGNICNTIPELYQQQAVSYSNIESS